MNKKRSTKNILLVILIVVIVISGYFVLIKKLAKVTPVQIRITQLETPILYSNTEYGFSFSLPLNWKEYFIVKKEWEGNMVEKQTGGDVKGPEILIRHPLWTSDVPRQDIPIMIFTLAQWDLVKQEKLSLGAAPIGPSELGRNANYVFALPARYNFAFPVGYEEVEKILQSNPFSTQ